MSDWKTHDYQDPHDAGEDECLLCYAEGDVIYNYALLCRDCLDEVLVEEASEKI